MLADEYEKQEQRADARAALVASVVANTFRSRKQPFGIDDFMLFSPKKKKREQTTEEMLQVVIALNKAFGGKVVKKDGSSS